jgi:hypothetical protein
MPVAEDLLREFLKIYQKLPHDRESQCEYLAERRAEIRLLLDSVWEQTASNILKVRPRNYLEARRAINRAKERGLNPPDAAVLRSVSSILEEYHVFVDKAYVDYAKRISGLVATSIRQLCLKLAAHPRLKHCAPAKQLGEVLRRTK